MIDIKPEAMETLREVITCAEYHPTDSSLCVFTTSAGAVHLVDTRIQALYRKNIVQSFESASNYPVNTFKQRGINRSISFNERNADASAMSPAVANVTNLLNFLSPDASIPSKQLRDNKDHNSPLQLQHTTFANEVGMSISDIK